MNGEKSAVSILEEAVNLLRSAPLRAVTAYLAGAVPFLLALLFFLNDMTRSPFASEHLAVSSLALAALYIWKNVCQAIFAAQLYRTLSPGDRKSLKFGRIVAIQAALQPVGLALALPLPWLTAFFRNAGLFAALGYPEPVRPARKQAVLWTRQNWGALGLIALAGILLFINLAIIIALLPELARSFLGIEGDFARLGLRIVNTATIAVAAALTWLAIDPLLDAVYILRCFYGESIATGQDLRGAIRKAIASAALLIAVFAAAPKATAQIDPAQLDHSINDVIHRREFTWRAPRPAGEAVQTPSWLRSVENVLAKAWNWVRAKIRKWLEPNAAPQGGGKQRPVTRGLLEGLIALALALIVGAAIFFFMRRGAPVSTAVAVTAAVPAPDLLDESTTADQLPEDSWLKLAEELLGRGDCRLALRALYLAGLNFMAGRGLISIAKWKSGLDYRREIKRRAKDNPGIDSIFNRISGIFERGWYGRHAVDREMVEAFAAGLSEIRNAAK